MQFSRMSEVDRGAGQLNIAPWAGNGEGGAAFVPEPRKLPADRKEVLVTCLGQITHYCVVYL